MFGNWSSWQIVLMVVFGTMWLVFIVLDYRRKLAAKKRQKERVQALKDEGYTDEQIKEILQQRNCSINKGGVK